MSKELSEQEIKKSVADFYKNVATGKEQSQVKPKDLSKAIGYSEEELASVPKEANLGLGCGNPQEKAQPQPGEMVVDLGCGKGMDVFIASKKVGDTGHVIGIDMLSDMIEKARIISTRRNFPNVEFRLGEIEHLPVADNTADLILSNCVINLSTNKPQVYREIFRILKPGGRIGISDITLDMVLPSSVTEDPKMYGTWVAGAITLDKLNTILQDAGFVDIDIETKVVTDEYAAKWGVDAVNLKDFIRSSTITAYKPLN